MTDASNIAIASILTQPDDEGHQHPVAYESRKLTAAERNYPAHVLELLAVVHSLRAFRHYLLGGGAPRPPGCWSDFDLRTDNQAITWLKTNKHLNKMYVRWLDEIEDFRFDVTHLPGARSPTDPLSRRGFADGDGPATSTGESDAESQQELFRLGHDAPIPAVLAAVRARWATTRRATAVAFANVQHTQLPTRGGGREIPPGAGMFIALAGAELPLCTGTTAAPSPPMPSDDLFLSPSFVQALSKELAEDALFRPIMRGAAAALCTPVDWHRAPLVDRTNTPSDGTFQVRCGLLYRRGQGEADRLCIPTGGGLRAQVLRNAKTARSGGTSGEPRRGRWCSASPPGWAKMSTSPSTFVPDVSEHQGGARRPARAPPSRAAAVAARWDDWWTWWTGSMGRRQRLPAST